MGEGAIFTPGAALMVQGLKLCQARRSPLRNLYQLFTLGSRSSIKRTLSTAWDSGVRVPCPETVVLLSSHLRSSVTRHRTFVGGKWTVYGELCTLDAPAAGFSLSWSVDTPPKRRSTLKYWYRYHQRTRRTR